MTITWHRGIGGGRYAFVQNAEGHWRKIIETPSGCVFVERCGADKMPMTGFTVHYATAEEAVASVLR